MAVMLRTLAMEMLRDEDVFEKIVADTVNTGRQVMGYCGRLYVYKRYGDFELVLSCRLNEEVRAFEIDEIDTHCSGNSVWDITPESIVKESENGGMLVLAKKHESCEGGVVIDLLENQVIPSFVKGDKIRVQVVGLTDSINYYKSEEDYEDSVPEPEFGRKSLLAENSLFPVGLLMQGEDADADIELSLYRGVVKRVEERYLQFGEEAVPAMVCAIVDTQYGELEIIHTEEQVKEEQRELIRPGSTIFASLIISADPAIYEYGAGYIKSKENDLRVLKEAMIKGRTAKLASRMAEDCIYKSKVGRHFTKGKQQIVDLLEGVYKDTKLDYSARQGVLKKSVSSIDDGMHQENEICLVLFGNDVPESACFLTYDEESNITSIQLLDATDLDLEIEPPYRDEALEDLMEGEPVSFVDSIYGRASIFDFCDGERLESIDDLENSEQLCERIEQLINQTDSLPCDNTAELEENYRTMLGKFFAEEFGDPDNEELIRIGKSFFNDISSRIRPAELREPEFYDLLTVMMAHLHYIGSKYRKENGK